MQRALAQVAARARPEHPVTIYYAFKQAEVDRSGATTSTGWQTFLEAAIEAGFSIGGTWPMRTERSARSTSIGTNALASSIVLCCRVSAKSKPIATRREFLAALRSQLPRAVRLLQSGNIAPVDLAHAAIGPGMAAYTRYERSKIGSVRNPRLPLVHGQTVNDARRTLERSAQHHERCDARGSATRRARHAPEPWSSDRPGGVSACASLVDELPRSRVRRAQRLPLVA